MRRYEIERREETINKYLTPVNIGEKNHPRRLPKFPKPTKWRCHIFIMDINYVKIF